MKKLLLIIILNIQGNDLNVELRVNVEQQRITAEFIHDLELITDLAQSTKALLPILKYSHSDINMLVKPKLLSNAIDTSLVSSLLMREIPTMALLMDLKLQTQKKLQQLETDHKALTSAITGSCVTRTMPKSSHITPYYE